MKFLLIRAGGWKQHKADNLVAPITHPPLGLLCVGAALEQRNHKVEIIDFYAENVTREQLKNALKSSDAVGISVYTKNYKQAADISRTIKELDSEIPVIIGGPHCIFFQKKSLLHIPHADIVVNGEGEHAILDIAQYFEGKKELSDIHGIHYKDNNQIKAGKPLQIIDKLDSLPFPARHLVDKYDYGDLPWGYQIKKKVTAMFTSRGCPFSCRFCTQYSNVIKGWNFREKSAESIVREIQEMDKKYRTILVVDDNFLVDIKRAHKIFDMLIESNKNVNLFLEGMRVESANRDLFLKMKKAGVKFIKYGIESGNQDVLDFYNKKITLQQIRNAVELSRDAGFITYGSFILGAPIETKKHLENTIKFACSLPLDIAVFGPLMYMKGSQLWLDAVKNKKISEDEHFVPADSRRGLGNFTIEELRRYSEGAFRRFYMRPSYIINQCYRGLLRKDLSLFTNGFNFLSDL